VTRLVDGADLTSFRATLARSHDMTTTVDLHRSGVFVRSLPSDGGTVSWDRLSAVRGRVSSLRVPGVAARDIQRGDEVVIYRGVVTRDVGTVTGAEPVYVLFGGDQVTFGGDQVTFGTVPTVTATAVDVVARSMLGAFSVQDVEVSDDLGGPVATISGEDLSCRLAAVTLTDALTWTTADTLETVVGDLVAEFAPYLEFVAVGSHPAPTITHEAGKAVWDIIVEAADAVGCEVWCDGYKVLWRPEPDPASVTVDHEFVDGAGGAWVSGSVGWSMRDQRRQVTVVGAAPDVSTEVAETVDLLSLHGIREVATSPQVDTAAKAAAAAAAKAWTASPNKVVRWSTWPHPHVEVGDGAHVRSRSIDVDAVVVIDEVEMGLRADDRMACVGRVAA